MKLSRLWFLAVPLLASLFALAQVAIAVTTSDACDLPNDLQREVASKYPGAVLVRLSDLDQDDSTRFRKEHGNACPALVKVDFYGDGKPTLALVLISNGGAKEKAQLVVAHQIAGRWKTVVLDSATSSSPVVWSQAPGEYRDVYGVTKVQATRPVIVFCEYESWAIVYAWTGKAVTKVWIAD
jgi:hypothetical protein